MQYKKMNMKKYFLNSLLVLAFAAGNSWAANRDPFSPSGSGINPPVAPTETAGSEVDEKNNKIYDNNPLTAMQLNSYKVVGVMISDNMKIASIKAISGSSYIVKPGDSLGSEGGKISDITIDGISVQTESQEIKIPVSNKVEVPEENGKK